MAIVLTREADKCKKMKIKAESPDGCYQAILEIVGQIRFGPPYFSLRIGEWDFGERFFGDVYLWSGDSVFFIIQEWLNASYQEGPKTALTLFDLSGRRECRISWADKGFIVPLAFEGNLLIYKKVYLDKGIIKEFEIDYRSLSRWEEIKVV